MKWIRESGNSWIFQIFMIFCKKEYESKSLDKSNLKRYQSLKDFIFKNNFENLHLIKPIIDVIIDKKYSLKTFYLGKRSIKNFQY